MSISIERQETFILRLPADDAILTWDQLKQLYDVVGKAIDERARNVTPV